MNRNLECAMAPPRTKESVAENLNPRKGLPAHAAPVPVNVCGIAMHSVTLAEVFAEVDERIRRNKPGYIVTPNVDHIVCYHENGEFREAYQNAFLVLPDGTPIIWASHLLGTPLREKISGSDLIYSLTEHAAQQGHSVFFLGGAEGLADMSAKVFKQMFPALKVAGAYCPPLGFEQDPVKNAQVLKALKEAAPDICYVALGSPKQDIWNWRYCEQAGVPVMVGVGGSFDFVTGRVRRAPQWLQKAGMEWLWRLCHEPRRLWKRYLVRDVRFFAYLWTEFWRMRQRQA